MSIVTRDSLQSMLTNPNPSYVAKVVGRALVALFQYQTASEKSSNTTDNQNGVGFAGCDAYSGSMTAKYFMKHGTLADWQVAKWTKIQKNGYARLCKYSNQLNKIAEDKASK